MGKLKLKDTLCFLGAAFFIPLLIMAAIHASIGVWPFGEKSILVLDLNGQYVYYFEALKDMLREGQSLLYSWSRALGGEFMGIFAYYLASPFSLITAIFPDGLMTEALMLMILLKVGSCGATMAFYLKKTKPDDNIKAVIISTMYALSSYGVVQAHNTMWIDALIYLPILSYAIEELIKKRRFKLYVITLTLSLCANYYIGYMICIYAVVYFLYYYIAHNENNENNFYYEDLHFVKSAVRLGGYSLIGAMLSAWVLMPAYYSLTFGKTTFSDPNFAPELKFDPLDMISKLFIGSYDTVEPSGLPFVYCGTLMLILLPAYFFIRRISARKKIMAGAVLAFFAVSFSVSTLDLVWHGFQNPNWLNYRYSFMFIFLALVFSYHALCEIEDLSYHKLIPITSAVVLTAFILQKLYDHIGTEAVVGTFVCGFALLLALHAVRYGYLQRGGVLILCVIVLVEMFSAGLLNTDALDADVVISTRESYNNFLNKVTPIVEQVQASDDGFYRMEKTLHRKTNDNLALEIKGLSNSTSTLNEAQIDFLARLGYSSRSHWSKYLGGTMVSDSLLGLKYIISDTEQGNGMYEVYAEDEDKGLTAYYNPYALSLCYAVSSGINDIQMDSFETPFQRMNTMVTAMLGEPETLEIFKEIPLESTVTNNMAGSFTSGHIKYEKQDENEPGRITYKITAPNDKPIYMYIPTEFPRDAELTVNSYSKGTYFGNETMRIVDLGSYREGNTLYVSLTMDESTLYILNNADNFFFYIDEELFAKAFAEFGESQLDITEHTNTRLFGNIDVAEGRDLLFTTIPYDEGWSVKIDGKKAELLKTADALLAVYITEGEHTVELEYSPILFRLGVAVSAVGVICFAAVWTVSAKTERKRKKSWLDSVDINR